MSKVQEEAKQGEIYLVNKPLGWTSFQAVKKMKWVTRAKKIGHAGTLDPLATGLLVLCSEKQTKKINEIQAAEKEYTGTITLGGTTPSYDLETQVNQTFPVDHITPELINETIGQFVGEIDQAPPLFSAIKVDGKRAYTMAREGSTHQLETRKIVIKSLEITVVNLPELHFKVVCSKGTYIRSLANDLGKALGSGGYLSALVRTRIGEYRLEDALTPQEWQQKLRPDNEEMPKSV